MLRLFFALCLLLLLYTYSSCADMSLSVDENTSREFLISAFKQEVVPQDMSGSIAGAEFVYSVDLEFQNISTFEDEIVLKLNAWISSDLKYLAEISPYNFNGEFEIKGRIYYEDIYPVVDFFHAEMVTQDVPEWCYHIIINKLINKLQGKPLDEIASQFPIQEQGSYYGSNYHIWIENLKIDFNASPEGITASFDLLIQLDFIDNDTYWIEDLRKISVSTTYNPVIKDESIYADFVDLIIQSHGIPEWLILLIEQFFEIELSEIPVYNDTLFEFDWMEPAVDVSFQVSLVSIDVTNDRIYGNAYLETEGTPPEFDLNVYPNPTENFIYNHIISNIACIMKTIIYDASMLYCVKTFESVIEVGDNTNSFYVGDLVSGIYYLQNLYWNNRKTYSSDIIKFIIVK